MTVRTHHLLRLPICWLLGHEWRTIDGLPTQPHLTHCDRCLGLLKEPSTS